MFNRLFVFLASALFLVTTPTISLITKLPSKGWSNSLLDYFSFYFNATKNVSCIACVIQSQGVSGIYSGVSRRDLFFDEANNVLGIKD
jgi:hypothetical protein